MDGRLRLAKHFAQEVGHDSCAAIVGEEWAPVRRPVYDLQLDSETGLPALPPQLQGLVDRHLRVLIAVQEQQRRRHLINIRDRAGKSRETGLLFRELGQDEAAVRGWTRAVLSSRAWVDMASRS